MKTLEQFKSEVKTYLLETTYGDKNKLSCDTLIFREGYIDSMGFISLVAFLNEKLGVKTSYVDYIEDNFKSINAIVNFISKRMM